MARGSPMVGVRLSHEMYADVMFELAKRNDNTLRELWELSDFVRAALREYVRKRRAGRVRHSRARQKGAVA